MKEARQEQQQQKIEEDSEEERYLLSDIFASSTEHKDYVEVENTDSTLQLSREPAVKFKKLSSKKWHVTVWSEDTVGLDHSFHSNTIAEMTWRG